MKRSVLHKDKRDIEREADRLYNEHSTFNRAIDAAIDLRDSNQGPVNRLFYTAVIDKLKKAKLSLGV